MRARSAWIVFVVLLLPVVAVQAEVSTDIPGAIVIFPKIVSDLNQDTIIQLSNATRGETFARCFYINAAIDPETQAPSWTVTDFQVHLTRLQPTTWIAGVGLPPTPPDTWPPEQADKYPGPVPPVGVGFVGELRCVVVNDNELPVSRNALTGEATIIDRNTHSTRKYRGVGIRGLPRNNNDNILLFNDVEYTTCPRILLLNHFFDDAPDPLLGTPINTNITFVPCSGNLEQTAPGTANLLFDVYNEFEERFSASFVVACYSDIRLSEIDSPSNPARSVFNFALQGSLVAQTRIRPVADSSTQAGHGIVAIAEELRDGGTVGAALNLHFIGGNLQPDVFVLPTPF